MISKKKNFKTIPTYILVLGALLGLSGCNSDSIKDLDNYFVEHRTRTPAPIKPIPEVKPYLRYIYPEHEKDPFNKDMLAPDPGSREIVDNGIEIDTTRVPEFLEGFPLDSLKMVGTVSKDDTLWALIRIPDGAVQSVKSGNYIGQNYGKITSITDINMSMMEIISNGLTGYKEREISIVLNQD